MSRSEVAIVHDYLTQRGGAERVVLSLLRIFPSAPLITAVYQPDTTYPEFAKYDVRPLWTNRLGSLRRDHRRGLLLYPFAFSGAQVDADVVLCSSSGFAHGIRTTGRKVVYCYSPPRWLYDQADVYLAAWPARIRRIVRVVGPALQRWDKRSAATADAYLTCSVIGQKRISDAYQIDAHVVPAPVHGAGGDVPRPVPGIEPGFVLCVSRLLAYKNCDAVVSAFDLLPGARLVVVGDGPEREHLKRTAGSNVSILGAVDDSELAWLYAECAGVVSAAYEDFGLAMLEAATYGKPVAVLKAGGFLDTVVEDETGVFFDEPEARSIAKAVCRLFADVWEADVIRLHAASFSESSFADQLRSTVGLGPPIAQPD